MDSRHKPHPACPSPPRCRPSHHAPGSCTPARATVAWRETVERGSEAWLCADTGCAQPTRSLRPPRATARAVPLTAASHTGAAAIPRTPATNPAAEPPAAVGAEPLAEPLAALLPRLRRPCAGQWTDDAGTRALYASDASNYRVLPAAVVAPRDADDLAAVVALASEAGVPLTMRGAGTSIAGNAIGPGLVVDTSRHLAGILELDPDGATVTVLPGTVLDDVNAAAAAHGLRVGPDPSTHSRCTVGGMIGNNACGCPIGPVGDDGRERRSGLEVVTADGRRGRVGDLRGPGRSPGGRADAGGACRPPSTGWSRCTATPSGASCPPWPRRVSGYGLDWLLPERGGNVARALVGQRGDVCRRLRGDPPPGAARPACAACSCVAFDGRHRGRDRRCPRCCRNARSPSRASPAISSPAGATRACCRRGGAWLLLEAGGDTDRCDARRTPRGWPSPLGTRVGARRCGRCTRPPAPRPRCGACARTAQAGPPASPTARPHGPASRTAPCRPTAWRRTCASSGRCCGTRT